MTLGKQKRVWKFLFWIYVAILLVVVVIKFNGSFIELSNRITQVKSSRAEGAWNVNLIPLRSIGRQLTDITEWWALKNILGNIIAFLPFGFLLPLAYTKCKSIGRVFVTSVLSVLVIEIFQLISMLGAFDIDDIILNVSSRFIGYVIFLFLQRFCSKGNREKI